MYLLIRAIYANDIEAIQEQLNFFPNKKLDDQVDSERNTPILLAAKLGFKNIVNYFLEHCEIDLRSWNQRGHNLLHNALESGNIELVNTLCTTHGFSWYAWSEPSFFCTSHSVMHSAALSGNSALITWLEERFFSIHTLTQDDESLIHYAAWGGHKDLIVLLQEKGLTLNAITKRGRTAIHYAALGGHDELLTWLVDQGLTLQACDYGGRSIMHFAAWGGHTTLIRSLEQEDIDKHKKDHMGRTIMHYAAWGAHEKLIDHLVQEDFELGLCDNKGRHVGHYAHMGFTVPTDYDLYSITNRKYFTLKPNIQNDVKQLIKTDIRYSLEKYGLAKWGINIKDNDNNLYLTYDALGGKWRDFLKQYYFIENAIKTTPIHYAALTGHVFILRNCLEDQASPKFKNKQGMTPMHFAAIGGHIDCLIYLKSKHFKVDEPDKDGATPLHHAAKHGHKPCVQWLQIQCGNSELKDNQGATPAHYAAWGGYFQLLIWMKAQGFDVDSRDKQGRSIVHYGAMGGYTVFLERLRKHGWALNDTDNNGANEVHYAAQYGHVRLLEQLQGQGFILNGLDRHQRSPVHYAAMGGSSNALDWLEDQGLDSTATDNAGFTALHHAAKHGHNLLLDRLISKGHNPALPDGEGLKPSVYFLKWLKKIITNNVEPWGSYHIYSRNILCYCAQKGIVELVLPHLELEPLDSKAENYDSHVEIENYLNEGEKLHSVSITGKESYYHKRSALDLIFEIDDTPALEAIINKNIIPYYFWRKERSKLDKNSSCYKVLTAHIFDVTKAGSQANEAHYTISKNRLRKRLVGITRENELNILKNEIQDLLQATSSTGANADKINKVLVNSVELEELLLSPAENPPKFRKRYGKWHSRHYAIGAHIDSILRLSQIPNIENTPLYTLIAKLYAYYKTGYDSFLKELKLRPSPASETEYKNLVHNFSPYWISIDEKNSLYLNDDAKKELIPSENGRFSGNCEYGTHIVRKYNEVHFKYHMESMPCYPAMEYVIASLYNTIAGARYGIAPTEIVKIRKKNYAQVLIASKTVNGPSLFEFLNDYAITKPDLINRFDKYSLSTIVILGLLTNPEDAKPDNFMLQFMEDENSKDMFWIKVVGIDNDSAFANPIVKKNRTTDTSTHCTEVKNVFYFFPQMHEPIDETLTQILLVRPATSIILDWLKSLATQEHYYYNLYRNEILNKSEWKTMQLPIKFAKKEDVYLVYRRLLNIQSLLRKNSSITLFEIFQFLYPELARYYEHILSESKARLKKATPAELILESLYTLYSSSAPSFEDANVPTNDKKYNLNSYYNVTTQIRDSFVTREFSLTQSIEFFIKKMDFNKIQSLDECRFILSQIQQFTELSELTIRNCNALDDVMMPQLVKSLPNLKRLYLVGCHSISASNVSDALHSRKTPIEIGFLECDKISPDDYSLIVNANTMANLVLLIKNHDGGLSAWKWDKHKARDILQEAIASGARLTQTQVQFIIREHLTLNGTSSTFFPLHFATMHNNISAVKTLIAAGFDPEDKDEDGRTALEIASSAPNLIGPKIIVSKATNSPLDFSESSCLNAVHNIEIAYRKRKHRH